MESGDEDDAFTMGEREWQKMNRDLSKQGYRDGKNEGREKGLQESFETATSIALKHSIKVGQLLGLIEWNVSQASSKLERDRLKALGESIAAHMNQMKDPQHATDRTPIELEEIWNKRLEELANEFLLLKPDSVSVISRIKDD